MTTKTSTIHQTTTIVDGKSATIHATCGCGWSSQTVSTLFHPDPRGLTQRRTEAHLHEHSFGEIAQTASASIPTPRTEWVDLYPDSGLDFGDVTDIYMED